MDRLPRALYVFAPFFALFVALFIAFSCPFALAGQAAHSPRVLFLSAYHPGFPTFYDQVEGLRDGFKDSAIELDVEFMDTKRFYDAENFEKFYNLLSYKLSRQAPYDLLIVGDDNALVFAIRHKDTLFQGLPVVFLGINNLEYAAAKARQFGFTGVLESMSFNETIDLIYELFPKTSQVVAVVDGTPTGGALLNSFKAAMRQRGQGLYSTIDMSGLSWDELPAQLAAYKDNAAFLHLAAYRDKNGITKNFAQILRTLVQNAESPLFHLWAHGIGDGILGGKVISFHEHGRLAAELALRVLNGESAAEIPLIPGGEANVYMFDWRVMQRFHISEAQVPEGSVLLHHQPGFYREHKPLIFQVGLIFLLMAMIIVYLLRVNKARRKAEKQARENEVKHRAYIEGAPDAVFIADEQGQFRELNPTAENLVGYTSKELQGLTLTDLIAPESLEKNHPELTRLGNEGVFSGGLDLTRKNGERVYVRLDAVALPEGGYIGFCKDMTAIRTAHIALEESEERFRLLVENSVDPFYLNTLDGVLIDVNSAACEQLNYTRDELLGMSVFDMDVASSPEKARSHWKQLQVGDAELIETKHRKKDGETFPVEVHMVKIRSGEEEWIFGVVRDMTVRKRFETELMAARDEAESASHSKSEFLANMSHELRTPLNGAMGMLQLMKSTRLDDEQTKYANIAIKSCRNLTTLLGDILDLSKIEAGRLEIHEEPVQVKEVFESIYDIFSVSAREKGVSLKLHVAPQIPDLLNGDTVRIKQVLFNLVGNAVKFTDQGAILVEAYPLPALDPRRYRMLIVVEDTGIGISSDKKDTVFDAFAQAEDSYTRNYQGAGLGLGIVKRLVELMGGDVYLESEIDHGTTIQCCLNLGRNVEKAPYLAPAAPPPSQRRLEGEAMQVLVAEDDSANSIALQHFLQVKGIQSTCVENGREALEALEKQNFDCILMDIRMPEMDGVTATKAIRNDADYQAVADIPIIALTAHAMEGDKERFLAAGMNAFIPKPVDFDELMELLQEIVG